MKGTSDPERDQIQQKKELLLQYRPLALEADRLRQELGGWDQLGPLPVQPALRRKLEELVRLRLSIREVVDALPDPTSRLILEYKYLDGLTWEEISDRMGYAVRHLTRLHSRALSQLPLPGKKEVTCGWQRGTMKDEAPRAIQRKGC